MREKIIGQDFSVLHICLSYNWSTLERKTIFDCSYIHNIGGSSTLLCFEGSQVDIEAEKEDINRIYIPKRKVVSLFDINFGLEIKKILGQNSFDLVHCYNLSYLWMLAFILKRNHEVPLFFTLNHSMSSLYHNFIAKWLLKRVDRIFTFSEEIKDLVAETFSVAPIKIRALGGGIEVAQASVNKRKEGILQQGESEQLKISCVVNNISELKYIQFVLKTFRMLKIQNGDTFSSLTLSIFLGPRVYQGGEAKRVLTELDHEFYKGDVYLYDLSSKMSEFKSSDILIGISFDEPLNDFEIHSLMSGACVLFPRTAVRQSLLFKHKWLGESYSWMDMREAVAKLSKILKNYSLYQSAILENYELLNSIHGVDLYVDELHSSYERAIAKRQRFRSSKLK